VRVDAIFDEFGDRLERVALRERNDADGIPVIADAQFAAVFALGFHAGSLSRIVEIYFKEHTVTQGVPMGQDSVQSP
jgi:hypothetical protein